MKDDNISRQAAINAIENTDCELTPSAWDELTNAIMILPSAQEWIPCSKRLPKYGVEVLTINKDDEYEINHIIDEEDGEWFLDGVVAWMPLPKKWERGHNDG